MPAATQVVAQVGAPVAAPVAAPDDSDAADAVRQVEDYMNRVKREADIKLEVAEAVRKADAEEAEFRRQRCIEVTAALTARGELAPAASPPPPPPPSLLPAAAAAAAVAAEAEAPSPPPPPPPPQQQQQPRAGASRDATYGRAGASGRVSSAQPPRLPPPLPPPPTARAHPLTFNKRQCQGQCCPPPSLPPSPAGGTPPSSDDGMDGPQVRLAHSTAHLAHWTLHTPCN